jgi:hypothetical protein
LNQGVAVRIRATGRHLCSAVIYTNRAIEQRRLGAPQVGPGMTVSSIVGNDIHGIYERDDVYALVERRPRIAYRRAQARAVLAFAHGPSSMQRCHLCERATASWHQPTWGCGPGTHTRGARAARGAGGNNSISGMTHGDSTESAIELSASGYSDVIG